jgi:hypothetical protein
MGEAAVAEGTIVTKAQLGGHLWHFCNSIVGMLTVNQLWKVVRED